MTSVLRHIDSESDFLKQILKCHRFYPKTSLSKSLGLLLHFLKFTPNSVNVEKRKQPENPICRDVPIELFTTRVRCRVFYRSLEYSADTGNSYRA